MISILVAMGLLSSLSGLEPDQFEKLGRQRADFGDVPNSGLWKYVGSHVPATTMYFPAGRSDVRYYVISRNGGWQGGRICCESKRGEKIHLDWMVKMKELKFKGSYPPAPGPNVKGYLQRDFISMGWVIPKHLPRAVMDALRDPRPMAQYELGHEGEFSAFFTTQVGPYEPSDNFVHIDLKDKMHLPRTLEPYPITRAERTYLLRSGKR